MVSLVDSHCHLDFNSFDQDRDAIMERARAAGVQRLLIPAIQMENCQAIQALARVYPGVWISVGVHPTEVAGWQTQWIEDLRGWAAHPRVAAVGEIGLDYYWDKSPAHLQKQAFRAQLELAAELELPVVIHNRDATTDVLDILVEWQSHLQAAGHTLASRPGVLHSFSGDLAAAERALAHQFYLGVTGPVTFRNAEVLRQVVAAAPLERLLIETDAPFLTPHPHRGKRNEPAYVRYIADKIAEIKNLPVEVVAETTTENANRLFKW